MMAKAKKTAAPARIPAEEIPYTVPANWRWVRLGSINQYEGDNVEPSAQSDTIFELYSVPCYEQKYPEIVAGEKIGSAKKSVKKNDVLLCKINPRINRVWKVEQYTEHPLIASGEWAIIRNPDIFADYLMRYFQAPVFRKYLLSNVSGVGGSLMRARPKFIDIYPVPLPPRVEQARIVVVIEELFGKLDAAEEKLRAVIEASPARRAALLRRAFTGALTEPWRATHDCDVNAVLSPAAPLSEAEAPYAIPDSWRWFRLGDVTKIVGGGTPSSKVAEYYENGTVPWLSPADLSSYTDTYISHGAKNITELGLEKSSAQLLPKDTVCLSSRAPIGYVVIAENPLCTNQGFKSFLPADCYLPKFLYWYLKGNKPLLENYASGTTFLELSAKKAGLVPFPVPPLDEQREIVRLLDELLTQEDAALLARAFRGQLGTNDPADPPALKDPPRP